MNEITTIDNKAPSIYSMDEDQAIAVLGESLYPGARPQSIMLVMDYCRAANLDPMQKPVHIVPMWDKATNGMRDVIMPGINSYRVNAMRSGDYLGISEPEFGPMVDGSAVGMSAFQFPEWCKVTVRRMLRGQVAEFTAVEYWMENYATTKRAEITPNAMWKKRPRGQIAKCAEAQALRKAFPEIASAPTYEEMEGKFDTAPAPVTKDMGAAMVVEPTLTEEEINAAGAEFVEAGRQGVEKLKEAWKAMAPDMRKALRSTQFYKDADQAAVDAGKSLSQKFEEAPDLDSLYLLADVGRELTEDERQAFEKRQQELEG